MQSSFASSESFPSTAGLHLIGACHLLQVDHIIALQQSKRRGGPKKALLQYVLKDQATGAPLHAGMREIEWKTIAQKNFSNRANISQYERNPFGAMRGGAGESEFLVVLHGARNGKSMSNAVGVNVSGKAVAQHPRFLLSSGKGEIGARSTILFFHANKHAQVELQRIWIEHRELKITIEQYDEEDANAAQVPIVAFAPKFKHVYAHREEKAESSSSSSTAMTDIMPAVSKPSSVKRATSRWAPVSDLSRQTSVLTTTTHSSSSASSSASSALPPLMPPTAVVERLAKRKRAHDHTLPVDAQIVAENAAFDLDHRNFKKEKQTDELNVAALLGGFTGFESTAGFDASSLLFPSFVEAPSVADEMMDQVTAESMLEATGGETPDSIYSDECATPHVEVNPPPFMHQVSADSDSSDDSDASQQAFSEVEMLMFEAQAEKYEPQQMQQPIEMQAECTIPFVLKNAHLLSGNPFSFQPFPASEASAKQFTLEPSASPVFTYPLAPSMSPPPLFEIDSSMQCRKSGGAQTQSQQSHTNITPPSAALPPHTKLRSSSLDPYAHLFSSTPPGHMRIPVPPTIRPPVRSLPHAAC